MDPDEHAAGGEPAAKTNNRAAWSTNTMDEEVMAGDTNPQEEMWLSLLTLRPPSSWSAGMAVIRHVREFRPDRQALKITPGPGAPPVSGP